MSDVGDLWRDFKEYVVPQIKATRIKRFDKFHANLVALQDLAEGWGISITAKNQGHHIQLRCQDYICNYYPSTRKFFFQRPKLTETVVVNPEDVLLEFLREARNIESAPKSEFSSWWSFCESARPPEEVVRVGSYLMPQIREEVLRLAAYRYQIIEGVEPREFEYLIAGLLRDQGFRADVTAATGDGGKDIIAVRDDSDREYLMLVECKKWLAQNVGIDIVQRAIGVKYIDKADHAMIVTTARFTEPAIKEAQKVTRELSLIDSSALRQWLADFERSRSTFRP